jgi:hypothetical protein
MMILWEVTGIKMRAGIRNKVFLNFIKEPENLMIFLKNYAKDGFVKSSPATGGTRRAETEEGSALQGAPQRRS